MATHILVVDDETAIADLVEVYLKNEGFTIHKFYNASDALACVRTTRLNLAVLDVMLPDMDGFQVVGALRARGNHTPVMMLTARAAIADKVTGLNAGADDYMTKPFDNAELLARLNALCRRTGEVVMNEVRCGDLTPDLNAAQLCAGGDQVQLSRKEFELARLFLTHPQQTLSVDAILSSVWWAGR